MSTERSTRRLALGGYATLIVLVAVWEAWGAPATSVARTFWLGMKVLPLLLPLAGLWRGNYRAYVLAALLVLLYFCDGVATAYVALRSGGGVMLAYGIAEVVLSLVIVVSASLQARIKLRRASLASLAGKVS